MNLFDLILLAILLYFSVQGYRNGLIRELFSVAGLLMALWVMTHYLDPMADWMGLFIDASETSLHVVSASMLFLSVYLLALLFALIIQKVLETIHLNVINRLAGLMFGTVKATLLLMAILLITSLVGFPGSETTNTSLFYPLLTDAIPALLAEWIPGSWIPDSWLISSLQSHAETGMEFVSVTIEHSTEIETNAITTICG